MQAGNESVYYRWGLYRRGWRGEAYQEKSLRGGCHRGRCRRRHNVRAEETFAVCEGGCARNYVKNNDSGASYCK